MKNYIWVIIEKFSLVALKMLGMIILARFLSPQDFGAYAMVFVIVSVSNILIDSGMGGALIRKKTPSSIDFSTVFTFNVLLATAIAISLYCLKDYFVSFFHEDKLQSLIPLLAIAMFIRSLSIIPITKMTKSLMFKQQTIIGLVSYSIALCTSIYLAQQGYGVFSIGIMNIIEVLLVCASSYFIVRYIPAINFSYSSFKELFPFGIQLTLASIVKSIYDNTVNVILGRVYGATTLGYYYQANKINDIFCSTISSIINKAAFPQLVRSIDNPELLKRKLESLMSTTCWLTFLAISLVSSNSDFVIYILFGENWLESAWMLKIVILSGYGLITESVTRVILKSYGYSSIILKLELLKRSIGVVILLVASIYGLEYVLISFVALTVLFSAINIYVVGRNTIFGIYSQLRAMLTPFLFSLMIGLMSEALNSIFLHDTLSSFIIILVSLIIYGFVLVSYKIVKI